MGFGGLKRNTVTMIQIHSEKMQEWGKATTSYLENLWGSVLSLENDMKSSIKEDQC